MELLFQCDWKYQKRGWFNQKYLLFIQPSGAGVTVLCNRLDVAAQQ